MGIPVEFQGRQQATVSSNRFLAVPILNGTPQMEEDVEMS
jgi:hypothetical protein